MGLGGGAGRGSWGCWIRMKPRFKQGDRGGLAVHTFVNRDFEKRF